MNTLVLIPAYNEARSLSRLVRETTVTYPVVVVDDGSTDATADVARAAGAVVLQHAVNRGLGAALRTGFAYAQEHGYDGVITMDADGQHTPHDIPALMTALQNTRHDMIIGMRVGSDMPLIRRFYNTVGRILTWVLFGGGASDGQSGMRAIRVAALSRMQLRTSRMEISSELIAEAHRLRLAVASVPIRVSYTAYSMSKGQNFFEGARTAWRLLLRSFSV